MLLGAVPGGRLLGLVCCLLCMWAGPSAVAAKLVQDQLGRAMQVPEQPRRIVTLAASLTEIVFALGQGGRLVGVEQFSDYPAAARDLPKVGSYINPDVERVVALRPDLVLAIKDGNPYHIVARLEALGLPVYAVDPRNLEGIIATVGEIGALLGVEEQAQRLAADLSGRLERLRGLTAGLRLRPRVFFQIGTTPIVAVGSHTFLDELITTAGAVNLTAGKIPYPRFSQEQVVALRPEIIVITSMTRGEVFDKVKEGWRRWPSLPAVRDNRIFLVDSDLVDRPSPRIFDGLEQLFRLFHPDLAGELS
ncbi:MAG: ABC transporter substrate-binding protein [Desulfobacca sp.]|uniref:ABC transporter substrate-binding protein n=1 Tax=Desulfobacca sp. TaxID=2067990 RepID=UPI00404B19A5